MSSAVLPCPDPLQFERAWARLVSRAWRDPGFREELLADPTQALAADGVRVPTGMVLKTVDGASTLTVLLPLPSVPPHVAEACLNAGDDPDMAVCCCCCCSC